MNAIIVLIREIPESSSFHLCEDTGEEPSIDQEEGAHQKPNVPVP